MEAQQEYTESVSIDLEGNIKIRTSNQRELSFRMPYITQSDLHVLWGTIQALHSQGYNVDEVVEFIKKTNPIP